MAKVPKIKQPRQKRAKDGDVLLVGLGNGRFIHAVAVEDCCYAMFAPAFRLSGPIPMIDPAKRLYTLAVSNYAVTTGLWRKIGKCDPEVRRLIPPPLFFVHNDYEPDQWEIYSNKKLRRATRAQCVGVERMICWEPPVLEERLSANLKGKKSKWDLDTPLE